MKIEVGEIIALSNNKEYICLDSIKNGNEEYVYLLGNFKPAEVRFGIVRGDGENISIEVINNPEQKQEVLSLFQEHQNANGVMNRFGQ